MLYKIIRNDILKSKLITLTTMIFVAAASMLVSLAAILVINLSGAIDGLMRQAETPHFMQMHSGELDRARLEAFAAGNGDVKNFQLLEFLNVDGSEIIIGENSLAGSVQDNGFCTQSGKFDYLLDLDGNIIEAKDGELYVPIAYMRDGTAKIGDRADIDGKVLRVAGFLRDSQMNASLASSKRFLISDSDYTEILESGTVEYLIEFRLNDISLLSDFENSYAAAGLSANGPTITYPLFKFINAISDGLMIAVILLISMLIVAIAFMCIRFSLLTKIEDDYRDIGVMKAIGLRIRDIKKIYLSKYTVIAASGCILGFALSLVFKGMLLENIRLYMGESDKSSLELLFGIIGVLFIFSVIIIYVNEVLKRFRKISASEAIRFGISQENRSGSKHFRLSGNRLLNPNIYLGIKDVLSRKKLYLTMLAVLVISTFIIIVPQNLYNTISSKNFIKYMGIGDCDIRIDIQQTEDISEKAAEILDSMKSDSTVSSYALMSTKTYRLYLDNGLEQRLKIETGSHSIFPVEYSEGRLPEAEREIALSAMNASELGKKVGDRISVEIDGKLRALTVCGIYSDITNGGKTAKAVFSDNSAPVMWTVICAELADKSLIGGKVSEYAQNFDFAKVSDIDEYILQTFGSTMNSVGMASIAAIAVALIITVLITLLFMKMLIAKDRYSTAVMKALGFTNSDITAQYISRSVFVMIAGIVFGTFLANTLGELLAGAVISSFGASSFKFSVNPFVAYLFCPLAMIVTVLAATIIGTSGAGKLKISENIKE